MSTRARLPRVSRAVVGVALLAMACAIVTGCMPEAAPDPSDTVATPSSTPTTASPSPSPSETSPPASGFALPDSCEEIYSADMLASLTAQNPPLNDPGVTMDSSQSVQALELLSSGIPTIRCSWGQPSEMGLATNVSVADPAQTAVLIEALQAEGFGCESIWQGTLCLIEQRTIDFDDNEVLVGEAQFVRDDGWVSTRFINFMPEGYTEDIVSTLWG